MSVDGRMRLKRRLAQVAGRTAQRLESWSRAPRGDGDAPDGGPSAAFPSRYASRWRSRTDEEARHVILNSKDPEEFETSGQEELARLRPFIDADSVVVDIGCGIGRIAQYVAPVCRVLWAVDVSDAMLERARRRMASLDNVRYAICEDTHVPAIGDGSVDFVYSILVLQHLEREDAFLLLEDIRRMLRPGGRAFFTWPSLTRGYGLASFVDYAHSDERTNPARARIYTPEELKVVIPAAGFSDVEVVDDDNIVTVCRRS